MVANLNQVLSVLQLEALNPETSEERLREIIFKLVDFIELNERLTRLQREQIGNLKKSLEAFGKEIGYG